MELTVRNWPAQKSTACRATGAAAGAASGQGHGLPLGACEPASSWGQSSPLLVRIGSSSTQEIVLKGILGNLAATTKSPQNKPHFASTESGPGDPTPSRSQSRRNLGLQEPQTWDPQSRETAPKVRGAQECSKQHSSSYPSGTRWHLMVVLTCAS